MKRRIILAALAGGLVAIAAADPSALDTQTFALTAIDVVPTKAELDTALMASGSGSQTPVQRLEDLAANGSDAGVRLRAINALPQYCPMITGCGGSGDPIHDTLTTLIGDYQSQLTGANVVVLRAAIESLGALQKPEDKDTLATLLNHPSRDIRAASARALGELRNCLAVTALRVRYQNESSDQVKLAISETLRILSPPVCP